MKWRSWLMQLATCGMLSLASGRALAEYRHRVVVLEHEDDDDAGREITTRVRAELGAAGFDVVVLPSTDEDPKRAVESAGHELHPASVLLVERLLSNSNGKKHAAGAELWLADRMLRKTFVLRLKSREDDLRGEPARVAVQAVELVKARLAELAVTRDQEPPLPPRLPPERSLPAVPAQRSRHANLTLGVGLLEGFQEDEQVLTPVLRLAGTLPQHWTGESLVIDLRGSFVGLGRAARIEQGSDAATVRHSIIGFDAVARFLPRGVAQPFLSFGSGLLILDVMGDATDPARNASDHVTSGLVSIGGGLWLEPFEGFGIVLEGQLMSAWSKTVLRIAAENAAEIGAPLLLLSSGLVAEF